MAEYQIQVALVSETHDRGTFKEMWQGVNLKRSLIAIGANLFCQITGQSFVSKYATVFLSDVGSLDPLALQCINTAVFIFVVLVAMFLFDKIGRR